MYGVFVCLRKRPVIIDWPVNQFVNTCGRFFSSVCIIRRSQMSALIPVQSFESCAMYHREVDHKKRSSLDEITPPPSHQRALCFSSGRLRHQDFGYPAFLHVRTGDTRGVHGATEALAGKKYAIDCIPLTGGHAAQGKKERALSSIIPKTTVEKNEPVERVACCCCIHCTLKSDFDRLFTLTMVQTQKWNALLLALLPHPPSTLRLDISWACLPNYWHRRGLICNGPSSVGSWQPRRPSCGPLPYLFPVLLGSA